MTNDLLARLTEALDEEERVALDATDGPWLTRREPSVAAFADDEDWVIHTDTDTIGRAHSEQNAVHAALHDPARVLRQVTAHREIVEGYEKLTHNPDRLTDVALHLKWNVLRDVVRAIAGIYEVEAGL